MKLQKIILCVAAALTAFGASFGLSEIVRYLTAEEEIKCVAEKTADPVKSDTNVLPDILPSEVTFVPPRPAATPVPVATPEAENEEDSEDVDYIGGEYYIIGELPKGFKDFGSLTVDATDYSLASAEKGYQEVYIPPKGYVYANDKEFTFTRVAVSRKRLSFETEILKGISYQFTGKYVEENIDMGEYMAHAELEGVLTKLQNGKKVAEYKVKFEVGGC